VTMSPYGGRGFYDPHSEVNRLFDEMFSNLGSTISRQQRTQQTQWAPALDVVREDGDLLIRAELPGVKREDVEITLHERVLTISGERRVEEQKEGSGYYVRERRHGSFRRSLVLPHEVEEGQISARFEDGVLEVRVPGAATELEPKRIQIQGSSGEGGGGGSTAF
jgi:HSP20 family protein